MKGKKFSAPTATKRDKCNLVRRRARWALVHLNQGLCQDLGQGTMLEPAVQGQCGSGSDDQSKKGNPL